MSAKSTKATTPKKHSAKPSQVVETEAATPNDPQPTSTPETATDRSWNMGKIFWGLLVILVGILLLLDNLGVYSFNIAQLWQLWPVLVIGLGISFLQPRSTIAAAAVLILIAATLGLVVYAATRPVEGVRVSESQSNVTVESGVTEGEVVIRTGAGTLELESDSATPLASATLNSDVFELRQVTERRGNTQYVRFTTEGRSDWNFGMTKNDLALTLGEQLPTKLNIDAGASRVRGDLSGVKLRELTIKSGASDIDVTLGSKLTDSEVTLDAGASSVKLHVPRDTGVRIISEDGLSGKEFEDIDEVGEGRYESADFEAAATKITIRAKLGVSSFTIDRY